MWYPARFRKHHAHTRDPKNGFEFVYLDCVDWAKLTPDDYMFRPSTHCKHNRALCEAMLKFEPKQTPESSALLMRPLEILLEFGTEAVPEVPGDEWWRRHELEEPLNLNGDIFEDLGQGTIIRLPDEYHGAAKVGLRAIAVADGNGSRRDGNRPVRCSRGTCFSDGRCSDEREGRNQIDSFPQKALSMNLRLTGSQTLTSCDYWLPWEFLYPSTAVTGRTGPVRQRSLAHPVTAGLTRPLRKNGRLSTGRLTGRTARSPRPKWLSHKKYWDSQPAFLVSVRDFKSHHTSPDPAYRPCTVVRLCEPDISRPPIAIDNLTGTEKVPTKGRSRPASEHEDTPAPKRRAMSHTLRSRGPKGPKRRKWLLSLSARLWHRGQVGLQSMY
ncbi:hypothetical protein C8F04DRAFT_1202665 [Mycena alexandri]|uniref:Uncharacterized protein n=1 Tax=Mycena alexandri TaxID=1745969 RepID=A0AAD6WL55_9AGAR|nr:hypothetical protein C8F04DRAFT_1202665 [Mycena alexandri]